MYLVNYTPLPDNLLLHTIKEASKLVGGESDDVLYRFTCSRNDEITGYTVSLKGAPLRCVNPKGNRKSMSVVPLNGGMVVIKIPIEWLCGTGYGDEANLFTNELLKGIIHESSHIRDFQHGIDYSSVYYMKRWKNRPWEILAMTEENKFVDFDSNIRRHWLNYFSVV